MKHILLSLAFCFTAAAAFAQCCPYINSIVFMPEQPSENQNLFIVTNVSTPSQGNYLGQTNMIVGDTILVEACYFNGMATAPQTFVDTISLGALNPGNYFLLFTARISDSETICTPTEEFRDTVIAFTVNQAIGVREINTEQLGIYPSPTRDYVTLSFANGTHGLSGIERVEAIGVSGVVHRPRLISTGKDIALDTALLPPGYYQVTLMTRGGSVLRGAFVKQ